MDSICTLQRKAIKIVYNVRQRSSSLQLFHDLGTYPLDVLLEREILKTMQSLYSYDKPRDLKMYFEQKTYDHEIHFFKQGSDLMFP